MPLLEITHPAIQIDLRYASANNFTGKVIYDKAVALLHKEAHAALMRAADLAAAQGLGLLVYDAYRPVAAQWHDVVPVTADALHDVGGLIAHKDLETIGISGNCGQHS